jgi:transposase-like protein
MDDRTCDCRHPQCPLYGRMAPGARWKFRGWHRNATRFRCQACGQLVSARTGTAYAGIRTAADTYRRGATALAEGMSIRATGRLWGVDKDPVNHGLPVVGRHGQGVMNDCVRN